MLDVTPDERELIFRLAEKLTGCNTDMRREIFVQNVLRRAEHRKAPSIREYLATVSRDHLELSHLVSALTIHTTSWFRERPHYTWVEDFLRSQDCALRQKTVSLLSVGCSTAQELYSFALIFESLRREGVIQDYRLEGWDIDLIVLAKAGRGIFPMTDLTHIPKPYHRLLQVRALEPKTGDQAVEIDSAIMKRVHFRPVNVVAMPENLAMAFDMVVCRNLLIYFRQSQVTDIVHNLLSLLNSEGHLILGLGEGINTPEFHVQNAGPTVYKKRTETPLSVPKVRPLAIPTVPVGAVQRPRAILIGASTGGPEALANLLQTMPEGSAPVVVVQHISAEFMGSFGRHLSVTSGLKLVLVDGTVPLEPHSLYMTVGDSHLVLKEQQGRLCVTIAHTEPRNGHRPSIDVFFDSAAPLAGRLVAILLTGMGKDGAKGLLNLRKAGAFTMAQDEKSSVVYGMPREAQLLGAPLMVGDPYELRRTLDDLQSGRSSLPAVQMFARTLKSR